jgi:hypothetical protein
MSGADRRQGYFGVTPIFDAHLESTIVLARHQSVPEENWVANGTSSQGNRREWRAGAGWVRFVCAANAVGIGPDVVQTFLQQHSKLQSHRRELRASVGGRQESICQLLGFLRRLQRF